MDAWRNWSGKLTANPARIHHVRSEDDAAALAAEAAAAGTTIRPAGSSHSHAPLVPTTGIIVDTTGLSGVVSADRDTERAWVYAGTPIHALGRPLHDAGLALSNQGDIDRQSIGGAVATGTHGTGPTLTNLSAAVVGARVALVDGSIAACSADREPELWRVAQLSLGAVGIVTQLELQLRSAYRLRQRGWSESFTSMLERLDHVVHEGRHMEFFWYPTKDTVVAKVTEETDDQAAYPIGPEGGRCGWSHEVLPNHRTWPHTEMEYSVPAADGPACLSTIRELLARDFPDMGHPIEYRTVASDDVWLSPAHDRPSVTISIHMAASEDDRRLFGACEEIFVAFEGRPHWGKVHSRTGATLASRYPRWADWWRVRNERDPTGVFLNDHLRELAGGADD